MSWHLKFLSVDYWGASTHFKTLPLLLASLFFLSRLHPPSYGSVNHWFEGRCPVSLEAWTSLLLPSRDSSFVEGVVIASILPVSSVTSHSNSLYVLRDLFFKDVTAPREQHHFRLLSSATFLLKTKLHLGHNITSDLFHWQRWGNITLFFG